MSDTITAAYYSIEDFPVKNANDLDSLLYLVNSGKANLIGIWGTDQTEINISDMHVPAENQKPIYYTIEHRYVLAGTYQCILKGIAKMSDKAFAETKKALGMPTVPDGKIKELALMDYKASKYVLNKGLGINLPL